jgi:hypothetical protein
MDIGTHDFKRQSTFHKHTFAIASMRYALRFQVH